MTGLAGTERINGRDDRMETNKIGKGIFDPIGENRARFAERFGSQLAELFPAAVKDGEIDYAALLAELGQYAAAEASAKERYELTWAGKGNAKRIANTDVVARTLKYVPEESKHPETTENLYIEGDNLEVLKLLRSSYYNRIKMICIDPPYNTGNDFIYKDRFATSALEADKLEGNVDEEGNRLIANQKGSGRFHSSWLDLMYPRLKVARDLLTDDGVICISIDDNELYNLKKLCDEVFHESNFVATLPTVMNLKGNNDQFGFAGTHEYTVVYIKDMNSVEDLYGIALTEEDKEEYTLSDAKGPYKKGATLMRTGEAGAREKRPKGYYPIYVSADYTRMSLERQAPTDIEVYPKTKDGKEMSWRRSPETLRQSVDEFIITPTRDGVSFYKKQRLEDDMNLGKKPKSLFYKPQYSSGNGTDALKALFGGRVFDNPKPLQLIKDLISVGMREGIVLDFFSGSATVAQAVMELNAEDGGSRQYILVQLPEACDPKSEAYKAGFRTICDIGKERIRRAGEKIKAEYKDKEGIERLDTGFKVFRTADTNIRWFSEAVKSDLFTYDLTLSDKDALDFNPGFTDLDVVYEIMLRHRDIPLTASVERLTGIGDRTYLFAGAVVVCLEETVTEAVVDGIAAVEPLPFKIILRDSAFGDDISLKENAMLRLEARMHSMGGADKRGRAYRVEFL